MKIPEELKIKIELVSKLKKNKTIVKDGQLKQIFVYNKISEKFFRALEKFVRKLNKLDCVEDVLVNCGDNFKEQIKNEE